MNRRSHANRKHVVCRAITLAWFLACGFACEQKREPPPEPETATPAKTEIDMTHAASIRGDGRFAIPNIKLVLLHAETNAGVEGFALRSIPAGIDGSVFKFDVMHDASNATLLNTPIRLGGVRTLNRQGNGILTPSKFYQPKFAELILTELSDAEAGGTIRGEFYAFQTAIPTAPANVVELDISFRAVVHTK